MHDLSPVPLSIEWALRRQSRDFRSAMASDPIYRDANHPEPVERKPQNPAQPPAPEQKDNDVQLSGLPTGQAGAAFGRLSAAAQAYFANALAFAGAQPARIKGTADSAKRWATTGSLVKRFLLGTATLTLVALPTAAMAHYVAPQLTSGLVSSLAEHFVDPERVAKAHRDYDCTVVTRVAVPDSHPVFLRTDPECAGWKTVASPYEGQDEDRLVNALTVLEGPWTESFYSIGGLNWWGKIRGLFLIGGGSAPGLSVFEEIAADTTSPGWRAKLYNMATAATFFAEFDGPHDIAKFGTLGRTCVGYGVPMSVAAAGEVCGIMLGENRELSHQGACMLASAYVRPLFVTSTNAPLATQEAANQRFEDRRSIATLCLGRLLDEGYIDPAEHALAVEGLAAFKTPTIETLRGRRPNPMSWLDDALPGGAAIVLRDAARLVPGKNKRLTTTLTSVVQQRFAHAVTRSLEEQISPLLKPSLCVSGCNTPIDHLVVVARYNDDGRVTVEGVSASDSGMLYGPFNSAGELQPMSRSPGSITKLALASCLVRHAPPSAERKLCRDKRWGISDAGREPTDCQKPGDFSDAFTVLGKSENSSFASWVSEVPSAQLRQCLATVGAAFHEDEGPMSANDLVRNATLGTTAVLSPAAILRAFASEAWGTAHLPVVYAEQDPGEPIDLRGDLSIDQMIQLDRFLRASVDHLQGTLRGWNLGEGTTIRAAKSGTVGSAQKHDNKDKLVAAAFEHVGADGRASRYVAFALVGSPDATALGGVRTYDVRAVLAEAVKALLKEPLADSTEAQSTTQPEISL